MKVEIIGYERVDFTNKDKQEIKGFNLYYTEPCNNNGKGIKGNKKFVNDSICTSASLGVADVELTLSGNILSISWNK